MKNWLQRINLEMILFILALLLGAGMRFAQLGHPALIENEARLALQAQDILHGNDIFVSPEPGYILITSVMMFLFSTSNFTARLWPAVAGTLLIGAAWLLRDQIGRKPALILAFFIALDPALTAISRTASSQAEAITCLLLGSILLMRGLAGWAGLFLGLSLLGGPAVWPGAIGLGVLYWLYRGRTGDLNLASPALDWKKFAFVAAAVFGLVGSLFFLVPSGFSAAAGSLVAYLRGWAASAAVPFPRIFAVVLAYQLPAVVFGLAGLVWGIRKKSPIEQALGVWWGVSFLLAVVYPSRSVEDAAWAAIPMLVLAARQAARLVSPQAEDRLPVIGQAALTVVLSLFVIYTLLFSPAVVGQPLPIEPLIRMGMALVLLFAISGMVAWGWSLHVATTGLQWGALFLLAILSLSAVFHAAGFSRKPEAELISPSPYIASADLLSLSLLETTQWRPDPTKSPSIAVIDYDSAALRWILRDYPGAFFTSLAAASSQPDIVISAQTATPELAAEYRGQAITWTKAPAWSLLAPGEWLRWLVYRDVAPDGMENHQIIYWVKSDEFPGGGTSDVPVTVPADPNAAGQDPGIQ